MNRFRNVLLVVGVGAAAFGLGTGISLAQDDGSSSTTSPPTAEDQAPTARPEPSPERQAFRDCLAQNGAPERPGRLRRGGPDALSDADKAALDQSWEACKDLIPQPTAEQQAQIDAWKSCMADNGIDLPDIDRTVPPSQRPNRPQFDHQTMRAALDACKDLRPEGLGFGFGGPGGPGGHHGHHGHHGHGGPGCDLDKNGTDTPSTEAPSVEGTSFRPVSL